jgi:hypothetical protein
MDDKIQLKNEALDKMLNEWSNEISDLEIYRAAVAIFAADSSRGFGRAVAHARQLAKEVKGE